MPPSPACGRQALNGQRSATQVGILLWMQSCHSVLDTESHLSETLKQVQRDDKRSFRHEERSDDGEISSSIFRFLTFVRNDKNGSLTSHI